MEKVEIKKKDRVSLINKYVKNLTVKEQDALLTALKKKSLLDQAKKLDKSVRKNSLTIQEIVEEVRKVRSSKN